jgi:hypothetical protein
MLCGRKYLFLYCSIPHGIFDFSLGHTGTGKDMGKGHWCFLYVRVLQQKAVTLVVKAQNKMLKIFWNCGNAASEENPNLQSRYAL